MHLHTRQSRCALNSIDTYTTLCPSLYCDNAHNLTEYHLTIYDYTYAGIHFMCRYGNEYKIGHGFCFV